MLKEIEFPRRPMLHRNLTSTVKLQCTGSCFSLCAFLYTFTILFTLSSSCIRRTLKREVHLHAVSGFLDTNIFWFTAIHTFIFWMLETNIFIKDTTKILANISKQICKHNASLFNWQHFGKKKKQYDKTTQLESTLVQNPYIFDITYVPT